jgi:alpha-1,6-mannosyltransferase
MRLSFGLYARPEVQLVLAAVCTAALYIVLLLIPYPLLPLYSTPLLDLGKLADHAAVEALRLTAGFAALFACCIWGAQAARRLHGQRWLAVSLGAGLAFGLILTFVLPVGAADIYDYVFRARLWSVYNLNPLIVAPWTVSHDVWFRYAVWVSSASPYGPLWEILSHMFSLGAGESLLVNLVAYKLLAVASTLVCGLMVYDLLGERAFGERLASVSLVTWNPLLLFEGAVNGHNDLLMMACVLGGLWLYRRGWLHGALIACVMGGLVKAAALAALPVLGVSALRTAKQPLRFAVTGAAACVVVAGVTYAPFWVGWDTFVGLTALDTRFTASPATLLKLGMTGMLGNGPAESAARLLAVGLFIVLLAYQLRKVRGDFEGVGVRVFAALALLLAIGTLWFQPWYVTWIIVVAPFGGRHARRLALLWSAGALCTYLLFDFAWYWYPDLFNASGELGINAAALSLWAGPLLLAKIGARHRGVSGSSQIG